MSIRYAVDRAAMARASVAAVEHVLDGELDVGACCVHAILIQRELLKGAFALQNAPDLNRMR